VLGALCHVTAQVLVVLPMMQLNEMARLADWSRLLAAIDQVTGWDTHAGYSAGAADATAAVIEASPLGNALHRLAENGGWTGTATELLVAITPNRPPKGWPANPRAPRFRGRSDRTEQAQGRARTAP
jgi:hypothetical protein